MVGGGGSRQEWAARSSAIQLSASLLNDFEVCRFIALFCFFGLDFDQLSGLLASGERVARIPVLDCALDTSVCMYVV
jgi:hypothetical protein